MQIADRDSRMEHRWDKYRESAMQQYRLEREMAFIRQYACAAPMPTRTLDAGCGGGRVSLALLQAGLRVVGSDRDAEVLSIFRRRCAEAPAVSGDLIQQPFADNCFDCAVAIQCVEYVDHQKFLVEMNRLLRPGGLLIFDTINRHSYKWHLKRRAGRHLDLPSANLSCQEIIGALTDYGFDVEGVRGYGWPPFPHESNNRLVKAAVWLEKRLRLENLHSISPKVIIAARKGRE
jgi:SAM-dependent methyltransferase